MSSLVSNSLAAISASSPLGRDYGVQSGLVTGAFTLTAPNATVGGAALNSAYIGAPSGVVNGAPTITTSAFGINTPGTDYIDTLLYDTGGDYTAFIAIKNGNVSAAPIFMGFGSFGGNTGSVPGVAGFYFEAFSSTQVRLRDTVNSSGAVSNINVTLTVADLQTAGHLFCVQRGTVAGTTTWNVFNLTDSGVSAPATATSALPLDVNVENTIEIGRAAIVGGDGTNQGPAVITNFLLLQSVAGVGAFLTPAAILQVAAKMRTQQAALPASPFVI